MLNLSGTPYNYYYNFHCNLPLSDAFAPPCGLEVTQHLSRYDELHLSLSKSGMSDYCVKHQ